MICDFKFKDKSLLGSFFLKIFSVTSVSIASFERVGMNFKSVAWLLKEPKTLAWYHLD